VQIEDAAVDVTRVIDRLPVAREHRHDVRVRAEGELLLAARIVGGDHEDFRPGVDAAVVEEALAVGRPRGVGVHELVVGVVDECPGLEVVGVDVVDALAIGASDALPSGRPGRTAGRAPAWRWCAAVAVRVVDEAALVLAAHEECHPVIGRGPGDVARRCTSVTSHS
jgi:hypothetical protein